MNKGNVSDPPLRKNWRFQLLWVGAGVSSLGNSAINLALPVLILLTTGSPVLAGLAATVSIGAGLLLSAPAGVWVDRLDRRRILLTAEASQGLIWGAYAVIVYMNAVTAWNVVLAAALSGGAAAFTAPANAASLQALVPKPQLASAYAQAQARSYAIQLGGPPLGGVLYAISRTIPFLFQVFASTVAVACYALARVPRRPMTEAAPSATAKTNPAAAAARKTSMRKDIADAFRWLMRQRGLRAVLAVALVINPLVNAIWVPMIVMVNDRGGGAFDVGIIMAGVGVGGLVGALVSARVSRLVPAGKLVLVVGFVMGVCYCLTPLPLGIQWPIIPIVVSCLASPALNVALMALFGHIVPSNMMGRMSSLMNVMFKGLSPLGPLLGGLLAAGLGGSRALIVCGGLILAVTVIAAASPSLRDLNIPAEPTSESDQPAAAAPGPQQTTPAGAAEHPQLDLDTIRHLRQAGVIATTAVPAATLISALDAEEAEFLASLSARIKAASEADVVAHSDDRAEGGDHP